MLAASAHNSSVTFMYTIIAMFVPVDVLAADS